jgi:Protein of unknown function (DUF1236)
MMRNKLLATVAMTALIGCTSFAVAQNAGPQGGAMQSQGAQQHQMGGQSGSPGGGAVSGPSGGSAQNEPSTSGPQGSSPQGKGFSQEERNKSSTKPNPQGSAQERRGPQNQRGAQEQRGKEEQRGAQNQRGTEQRGAQDNDRAGTQERMGQDQDRGKAVPGQAQQNGTSGRAGGASVQLSQDQRTKIKDVIVRDRNVARVNGANFSVSVGARVPRDVHVTVLPPEVVTIVPEYRGFEYVLVGDQLLIIDPDTLEIVAILPA